MTSRGPVSKIPRPNSLPSSPVEEVTTPSKRLTSSIPKWTPNARIPPTPKRIQPVPVAEDKKLVNKKPLAVTPTSPRSPRTPPVPATVPRVANSPSPKLTPKQLPATPLAKTSPGLVEKNATPQAPKVEPPQALTTNSPDVSFVAGPIDLIEEETKAMFQLSAMLAVATQEAYGVKFQVLPELENEIEDTRFPSRLCFPENKPPTPVLPHSPIAKLSEKNRSATKIVLPPLIPQPTPTASETEDCFRGIEESVSRMESVLADVDITGVNIPVDQSLTPEVKESLTSLLCNKDFIQAYSELVQECSVADPSSVDKQKEVKEIPLIRKQGMPLPFDDESEMGLHSSFKPNGGGKTVAEIREGISAQTQTSKPVVILPSEPPIALESFSKASLLDDTQPPANLDEESEFAETDVCEEAEENEDDASVDLNAYYTDETTDVEVINFEDHDDEESEEELIQTITLPPPGSSGSGKKAKTIFSLETTTQPEVVSEVESGDGYGVKAQKREPSPVEEVSSLVELHEKRSGGFEVESSEDECALHDEFDRKVNDTKTKEEVTIRKEPGQYRFACRASLPSEECLILRPISPTSLSYRTSFEIYNASSKIHGFQIIGNTSGAAHFQVSPAKGIVHPRGSITVSVQTRGNLVNEWILDDKFSVETFRCETGDPSLIPERYHKLVNSAPQLISAQPISKIILWNPHNLIDAMNVIDSVTDLDARMRLKATIHRENSQLMTKGEGEGGRIKHLLKMKSEMEITSDRMEGLVAKMTQLRNLSYFLLVSVFFAFAVVYILPAMYTTVIVEEEGVVSVAVPQKIHPEEPLDYWNILKPYFVW